MTGTVKSAARFANVVRGRVFRKRKSARISQGEKGEATRVAKRQKTEAAATAARAVLPNFANEGGLSVLHFPRGTDTIAPADPIKRAGGLPCDPCFALLRTLCVFASAGEAFGDIAPLRPLRCLIVTKQQGVADHLAKIVTDHSLFPKLRIHVHVIGTDEWGAIDVRDLGRIVNVTSPHLICWEVSLGLREHCMQFVGLCSTAHLIATDIKPSPQPPRVDHAPVVEVYRIFDVKPHGGTFRIVGEDKKPRAAFTVATDGRIEPVPTHNRFNFRVRLSATRDDVAETEIEGATE